MDQEDQENQEKPASIRYEDASEALVEQLPELREAYEEELQWWGNETPGQHVVYGNILNPYIERLLQSGEEAALHRVFGFLEILSRNEDLQVQEIVAFTVCEGLLGDALLLQLARRYMGPSTLRLSEEVERFWKGES